MCVCVCDIERCNLRFSQSPYCITNCLLTASPTVSLLHHQLSSYCTTNRLLTTSPTVSLLHHQHHQQSPYCTTICLLTSSPTVSLLHHQLSPYFITNCLLTAPPTVSLLHHQLSPVHKVKWPGFRVQITCNTLGAYDVQHVVCYVVRRDISAIKFGTNDIACLSLMFRA